MLIVIVASGRIVFSTTVQDGYNCRMGRTSDAQPNQELFGYVIRRQVQPRTTVMQNGLRVRIASPKDAAVINFDPRIPFWHLNTSNNPLLSEKLALALVAHHVA